MLRSDAEHTIRLWNEFDKVVFKWRREFVPDDFIVLKKLKAVDWEGKQITQFFVDQANSTAKMEDIDMDKLLKLMTTEEFVYVQTFAQWISPLNMKTGGCQCGSWILPDNKYLHERNCPSYVNPFNK